MGKASRKPKESEGGRNGAGEGFGPPETGQEPARIVIPKPDIRVVPVRIVGTSPLLVHAWSRKAMQMMLDAQTKKARAPKAAKNPEEDVRDSLYLDAKEKWCGVPVAAFKEALVGACRLASGVTMTLAKRVLFIEADGATDRGKPLVRIQGDWEPHEDMVRVGSGMNKTADIRYRAVFPEWSATLRIRFHATVISLEEVINLVSLAGFSEGVCEGRPSAPKSNSGTNGCWEVLSDGEGE